KPPSGGLDRPGQLRGDLGNRFPPIEQLSERVPLAVDEAPACALRHFADKRPVAEADPRLGEGEIDLDLLLRALPDEPRERVAIGRSKRHARDSERSRVTEEDLREALGEDRADAEIVERLGRVLTRAPAPEVSSGNQYAGAAVAGIVERVAERAALLVEADVVEGIGAEAVEGHALQVASGNDSVGVDVVAGDVDALPAYLPNLRQRHRRSPL